MEATPAQKERSTALVVAMLVLAAAGAASRVSCPGEPPAPCPAPGMVAGVLVCNSGAAGAPVGTRAGARAWLVGQKLDVNDAKMSELEAIPGIGPSMARAIVDARTARGRFASFEDLDAVEGVGPKTLETLGAFLEVREAPPRSP